MTQKLDTREVLRPYQKHRLGFEGVLIDIIEPNAKNGYNYGLVFGSVYAPNENIELDHAVVKMTRPVFSECRSILSPFYRYYFTAEVGLYWKTGVFEGIEAWTESFMLSDIRPHKLEVREYSHLTQPTAFIKTRIQNVLKNKTDVSQYTEDDLIQIVKQIPNDGQVEEFIANYNYSYQRKKITQHDMDQALYKHAQ